MPANDNWPSAIISSLLEDSTVVVPEPLLKYYNRLGLTETEVMIIIHLLRWRQIEHDRFPSPEKLSQYLSMDSEEVKNILAGLIEKKLLSVEPYYSPVTGRWLNAFSLYNLWEKLAHILTRESLLQTAPSEQAATVDPGLGELYRIFEKEFGRPLSPIESSQLADWYHNTNLSPELIIEALKRAVLRGALNFRYIDSILRDWIRHNIRTVQEAINYDDRLLSKKAGKKKSSEASGDDKYRDLYRLDPEP